MTDGAPQGNGCPVLHRFHPPNLPRPNTNAGTHSHRPEFCEWYRRPRVNERSRGIGPRVRGDDGAYRNVIANPLRSAFAINPVWRPDSSSTAPFWLLSTMARAPRPTARPAPAAP